jgi:hypothetical protein
MTYPFGLVFPPTRLPTTLEIEVVPGHTLRQATRDERASLETALVPFGGHGDIRAPFVEEQRRNLWGPDAKWGDLPECYFAVLARHATEPGPVNDGAIKFAQAASLMDFEHSPVVRLHLFSAGSSACSDLCMSAPWERWEPSAAQVAGVREMHDQAKALDLSHTRVHGAIELFWGYYDRQLPPMLKVLALMSVVECLLTHNARGQDDAVSRQIQAKVPLLLRRAGSLFHPFGCSIHELWEQLYRLRSGIAHGKRPKLGQGKLDRLPDAQSVIDYLLNATRALLRYAIVDPVLVEDLANC